MNATNRKSSRGTIARVVASVGAALILCGALVGCGAPQPPAEGTCREWREWVPPQQDDEGNWQEGYCRDRE